MGTLPGGTPSVLVKYAVRGKALEVVGVNPVAALLDTAARPLVRVSGDGRRVGVVSNQGYAPAPLPRGGGGQFDRRGVGLFAANNVNSLEGIARCVSPVTVGGMPHDLAFHSVLKLGAAEAVGQLHLFNSKSLIEITTYLPLIGGARKPSARLLTFGARGTKLVYYEPIHGYLYLIPLTLTDQDKEALAKAYAVAGK
jgi:hypothetical protein